MPLPNEQDDERQPDMFTGSGGHSLIPDEAGERPRRRAVPLKSNRSLERLRDRVLLATRELRRLREENAQLHRQIEELQTTGLGAVDGTPVVFTESAPVLKNRLETFIETLDQYLELSEEEVATTDREEAQ